MQFSHLKQTSLWNALSPLGKRIETQKGIFYWSSRAREEAEIDGTIGIAQDDDGTISHLKIAEEWAGAKIMQRVPKAKIFAYAPITGVESLRKKWLNWILQKHPSLAPYATTPVVTNGITHSLALASRLLLSPGDTIITAEKSWENYEHIFTGVQNVKIVTFPLFRGHGELHLDALIGMCREVAHIQKKVVLLLNFPHNQTGFMPSENTCKRLGERLNELCKSAPSVPFVILIDDAYEGYVYDDTGKKKSIIAELFAPLPNLSIAKMDGISKVMLAYGYRVGFLTFFVNSLDGGRNFDEEFKKGLNDEMASKIGGLIRGEISQVNHHGQILADALMDELGIVTEQRNFVILRLKERWQNFTAALEACYKKYGRQKVWSDPCNAGFFAYLNLADGIDAKEIAERLIKEKKVGVVPSGKGLRIAFCGVSKEKVGRLVEAVFEVVENGCMENRKW